MINPVKTAVKCCGCIVLTQLIGIAISIGALVAFVLAFYLYAIPWGEDQIREALHLGSDVDIGSLNASIIAANNCSGCVFGVNTDWPTNTTGTLHFLDTSAGPTASAVIATSLVAGAGAGVASMLWASFFPSAASVLSFSSGFYEMTHIVEQAQFIGMISQLQIDGAPVFLHQFSRELAWTNFNVPKSITDAVQSTRRRRLDSSLLATTASGETGPKRYAALIGVEPQHLFFYTLLSFAIVVAAIHVLYVLGVVVLSMCSKKESASTVAAKLYRKVVWATLLALLLAQYIFSMAGSYYIYENADVGTDGKRDTYFVWGAIALVVMVTFAVLFGVLVISSNRDELEDLGTYEHEQRPFAAKYGAYYDEYNFDNRFFFVPRILLAVSTGAVVGVVQDATTQLLSILGLTLAYLVLLLAREPHLLRFLYYIGITSVFLKVVLVCMMLLLVQDDFFPQSVRDNVAYGIVGVNMFIFFLLFLRQAYTIGHKLVRGCKNKDKAARSSSDDDDGGRDVINLERGNNNNNAGGSGGAAQQTPYARMESTADKNGDRRGQQSQQQGYGHQSVPQQQQGYGNATAATTQQSAYTQPFARDNVGFGGVQRSPYERLPSDAAVGAGVGVVAGAGAGKNNAHNAQVQRDTSNDWGRYNAHAQEPQHLNATGGAAAGAMVGAAAAARDRPYGAKDGAKNGASPVRGAAARGDSSPSNQFATASPAPYQALSSANQFGKPLRKTSIDLDDMEDGDVVAEPPVYTSTSSAQQFAAAGVASREPPRVRQSYLRFSDSDMSSLDDDIDGRSPRSSASGASRAPPVSATSVSSNFSVESSATDWFDRRSKTEIEDADDAAVGATAGAAVAIGASAFTQRDSMDSYTTDLDTNRTLLTATSAASSSDFGTDRSIDTAGFSFEDAAAASDARDVDIDADEPLRSYSVDSYGTDVAAGSNRSLNSSDSAAATAYLRGTGADSTQGENDIGDSDDDDYYDDVDDDAMHRGSGAQNANDSFLSAVSTRSEDDVQFYIDGQRRHTGSPVARGAARESLQQRTKKL